MIVDNSAIPAAQRFKLAALNCLEEKMMPLWQAVQLSAQNFFQNQAGGVAGAARLLMNVSDFGVRDFNSSSSTAVSC